MKRALLLFLCCGLALLGTWTVIGGGMQLWSGIQSRDWPATTGEVVSSEARYSTGKGSSRYELSVNYRYRVADVPYQSSRVRAVGHNGTKEEVVAKVHGLLPGSAVTVYYDPIDPSVAYLERGVAPLEFLVLAIGSVLVVISFVAIKAITKKKE